MKRTITSFLTIAALAAPGTALAQDARDGYDRTLGVIGEIEQVEPNNTPSAAPAPAPAPAPAAAPVASEGSLPFTGADVGLVAALGGALIAAGFGLRRMRTEQ